MPTSGVYTTSEQRARALYTLYIARRVPARHSRKAARKSKGGQSGGAQQLASPQHLAASDTYIRHRHAPLPIPDVFSCLFYYSLSASPRRFPISLVSLPAFPPIRLSNASFSLHIRVLAHNAAKHECCSLEKVISLELSYLITEL